MNFIREYINKLADDGMQGQEIADQLGVSISMVSSYKLHNYNPSITVAKHMYGTKGIVFHPFSEESLKLEIEKDTNVK